MHELVSSQYSLTFTTGDFTGCGSPSIFQVTFIDDTKSKSASFNFTPNGVVGGTFTRTFNNTWIGFIQEMTLKAIGLDGWCFKQFTLLQDINFTHNLWIDCNTIGYNSYDHIILDKDASMVQESTVNVTLDLSRSSPTLNCTWTTTNTTFTNTDGCENIDGGGWKLVRHVSDDYGGWHPATDDCLGTQEYGIVDFNAQSSNTYSVAFESVIAIGSGSDNQFLFAFGDCSSWVVTTRTEAIGDYYNDEYRCILNSSESSQPYSVIWNNRGDVWSEDPWISTLDNSVSVDTYTVLYVEDGSTSYIDGLLTHNGANVWIRQVDNDTRYCWDTQRPTTQPTPSPIDEYQGIYNSNDFYSVNGYKCGVNTNLSQIAFSSSAEECQNECIDYYDNTTDSASECVSVVYFADTLQCNLYSNCYLDDLVIGNYATFFARYQYDVYQDYGCSGQNDEVIYGLELEECTTECKNDDNCISFEYFSSNLCQLSSTCDLSNGAQQLTFSGGLTISLYIKAKVNANSSFTGKSKNNVNTCFNFW